MATLSKWFEKGIPAQQYVDEMKTHQENLLQIYNQFTVQASDHELFKQIAEKKIRVIVLTEDWCGDAMLNIPILMRIAEQAQMDVRMLYRDQNLELMDQYLTNGTSRSIPIFIFIDEDGNELAHWGSRAPEVQAFVDQAREKLPSEDDAMFQEKRQEMIKNMTETFTSDHNMWAHVYNSLIATLKTL